MSDTSTGRRPAASRGRKRDDDRTEAILQVAVQLLLEVGFDQFRVQDVAERAGSGTGAIYRRWETKEALAADAVRVIPDAEFVATDDPEADLYALIHHKLALAAQNPDLLPGAVVAIRSDERIADAFRERYSLEPYRQAIARVLGETHPQLDLLAELTSALALHRNSLSTENIDPDSLTQQIVSLVRDLRPDANAA